MMIIGITGTLGAGKGTIVDYLIKEKGFAHFSVRSYLVDEIILRKLPVNRDSMVLVANELREKYGSSYLIDQLYEQSLKSGRNAIIESIRTPGEIDSLRKKGHFFLFAVDAEAHKRYDRIQIRNSETDNVSFETFLENEHREMNSTDPNHQNLQRCINMANYIFDNNGTIDQLNQQVDKALIDIQGKGNMQENIRPSWDEYFMELARTVAKRATCDRGRSGCVIARNKQILVTGYVGSPTGLPHCDEVGHLFKKVIHEDGKITNHCMRTVHAEQNAICQAAKMGIALENATLYCRMTPCRTCAMLIINCGITRVVCEFRYHAGDESEEMFRQAGITLDYFNHDVLEYSNQK